MGVPLQPRQQGHGPTVVEIGVNGFDGLVVIAPDSPDLGIEIRQAQVVGVRVLVTVQIADRQMKE